MSKTRPHLTTLFLGENLQMLGENHIMRRSVAELATLMSRRRFAASSWRFADEYGVVG